MISMMNPSLQPFVNYHITALNYTFRKTACWSTILDKFLTLCRGVREWGSVHRYLLSGWYAELTPNVLFSSLLLVNKPPTSITPCLNLYVSCSGAAYFWGTKINTRPFERKLLCFILHQTRPPRHIGECFCSTSRV